MISLQRGLLVLFCLLVSAGLAVPLGAQAGNAKAAIRAGAKTWKAKPPEFRWQLPAGGAGSLLQVDGWAKSRLDALRAVGAFHGMAAAKFLVKHSLHLERDLASVDVRRAKLKKAIAAGFQAMQKAAAKRKGPVTTGTPGAMKYVKNSSEASYHRRIRDGLEAESEEISRQAGALDANAAQYVLERVLGKKTQPLTLKIAAARRIASEGKAAVPILMASLRKARAPAEIAVMLQAIGGFREVARPAAEPLLEYLQHADAGVREQAALALSVIAVPAAIEPMIGLLARERGVAQRRIAAALEVLTRQKFGLRISAWQSWFTKEGAAYLSGAKPVGGGKPSAADKFNEKNYYYGIKQDGKAILYILDCSGSMAVSFDNPKFRDPKRQQPLPAGPGEVSRMAACVERLSQALGMLHSSQRFNILAYSFEPKLYKSKMQDASKKNIEAAQAYLKTLKADGATNIYDSMQLAFQATGRGSYDKAYGVDCDMMFLLTDGKPTLPGSADGFDMTESILAGVRKWNALQRVVLHTIGIGKDLNEGFMAKLAAENGGDFRDKDGKKRSAKAAKPAAAGKGKKPRPQGAGKGGK